MSKRSSIHVIIATISALLLLITNLSLVQAQSGSNAYYQLVPEAQSIVNAVNDLRTRYGLAPLVVNPYLSLAAQNHCNDSVASNYLGHYGSDGSNVRMRVQRTGYQPQMVSENWVLTGDAASAMQWWIADPPHLQNMLSAYWTEIGVGLSRHPQSGLIMWVTDFAGGHGTVAPAPVVAPTQPKQVAVPEPVAAAPAALPLHDAEYIVQSGDTLLVIAQRYGMTWEALAQVNGLTGASMLHIGQIIRIPGTQGQGGAVAVQNANYTGSYHVQAGDTLVTISNRYGVTWQELAAANGLGEFDILQIGQSLSVPGADTDVANAVVAAVTDESTPVLYTIGEGDTIFAIAMQHQLDWQSLLAINNLQESSVLQLGQQIRLR